MDTLDQDEFRFEQIEKLKLSVELAIQTRKKLNKRYKKASSVITWLETSSFIIGAIIAAVGASGVIVNVVSIPVSVIFCVLGVVGKVTKKVAGPKLKMKAEKHYNIMCMNDTSLNAINNILSKSITDGHISSSEFELVIQEMEKLHSQVSEITSTSS